jgi:hypothetical protein
MEVGYAELGHAITLNTRAWYESCCCNASSEPFQPEARSHARCPHVDLLGTSVPPCAC